MYSNVINLSWIFQNRRAKVRHQVSLPKNQNDATRSANAMLIADIRNHRNPRKRSMTKCRNVSHTKSSGWQIADITAIVQQDTLGSREICQLILMEEVGAMQESLIGDSPRKWLLQESVRLTNVLSSWYVVRVRWWGRWKLCQVDEWLPGSIDSFHLISIICFSSAFRMACDTKCAMEAACLGLVPLLWNARLQLH